MIGLTLLHYRIVKKLGEADPDWAALRGDARFAELMRRLGEEREGNE
jgi:hypothetical protein